LVEAGDRTTAHAVVDRMKFLAVMFVALSLALCACSPGASSSPGVLATETAPGTLAPTVSSAPKPEKPDGPPSVLSDSTARWIEVSLREQVVRLHDSGKVVGEYAASTGVGDRPEYTNLPRRL
jgi:hypothetical protein